MNRIAHILLILAAGLAVSIPAQAITRYVDDTGADTSDCSDALDPCATISHAIDQAVPGDTIAIAAGTYTESGGLGINHALQLQGAGEDSTIIQAHAEPGMATSRVVSICLDFTVCPDGNFDVEITDLTIRHGVAAVGTQNAAAGGGLLVQAAGLTLTNVAFRANTARAGGAMYVVQSVAALANVTFVENHANSGGAMYAGAGSFPDLADVTFSANTANPGTVGDGGGFGGGMYNNDSFPTLVNVAFDGNSAAEAGGGMFNVASSPQLAGVTFTGNSTTASSSGSAGGGMGNSSSSPVLVDVQFIDNVSAGHGGGMYNFNKSAPILTNVIFRGNAAVGSAGGGMSNIVESSPTLRNVRFEGNTANFSGGGLRTTSGHATLVNVAFIDNASAAGGGGLYIFEGSAALTNVTFSGNSAEQVGGGLSVESGGSATLSNTILWGNTASGGSEIAAFDGSVQLSYGLYRNGQGDVIGTGFTADNSLTSDPLFVDAANGDHHLAEGSPAVNSADPATDLELYPVDGNGDPVDLDGNPRLVGPGVDMGTYESAFETPIEPVLMLEPSALAFGDVGVGVTSPPRTAQLRNLGNGAATGLDFDLSDSAFSVDSSDCGETLAVGAACEVAVTFTPDATGLVTGQLTIASAEGASALLALTGTGVVLPPRIDTDPDSVAIVVPQEETGVHSLQINNLGQQVLDWTIATADASKASPNGAVVDCEAEPGLVSHDDGTIEFGFPSFAPGVMLVDHFVPASYPAALRAACLALMTTSTTSVDFEIVVLADDGPGGQPGTELGALAFSAEDIPVFTPPPPPGMQPTWSSYDLSPLGLSIESGGVYVGVRWAQADESVFLAIDTSPPNPPGFAGGYAFGLQPGAWLPMDAVFPDYRALFVRVVAESGSACVSSTAVGWLDIDPAAGSTPGGASSEVALRFDTHDLAPGSYETLLCIASNDPAQPAATVPITLTVVDPVARSITVLGGDDQIAGVGMPFPIPLAVQVRDGSSRPLADVTVTFTAPAAGASAVLSETIVTTDGEGYAAISAVANGEAGDYVVEATVDGIAAPASFHLGNRAASVDVGVLLDAQRDHVQPGQMLDYLVTMTNAGPDAADGATIASVLAPQLDLDFATWLCIGPVASGCTSNGAGNLADGDIAIPAGGSVSYLLSAPVRLDAHGLLESRAQAGHPDDQNPANDEATSGSQVVVYRNGFEPYADGNGSLLRLDGDFAIGDALHLIWPERGATLVDTVLLARCTDGTACFRIDRLNTQPAMHLRLTGRDRAGNEYSTIWLAVDAETAFELEILDATSGDGRHRMGLRLPAAELQLPLDGDIAGIRLWSIDSLQRSEPTR